TVGAQRGCFPGAHTLDHNLASFGSLLKGAPSVSGRAAAVGRLVAVLPGRFRRVVYWRRRGWRFTRPRIVAPDLPPPRHVPPGRRAGRRPSAPARAPGANPSAPSPAGHATAESGLRRAEGAVTTSRRPASPATAHRAADER